MQLKAGADGIVLAYIEHFYEATSDHERAIYGAMIVGALEQIISDKLARDEKNERSDG